MVAAVATAGGAAAVVRRSATSTLTLYNAQHEETTDALVTAFEQQTDIQVKTRNGDEGEFERFFERRTGSSSRIGPVKGDGVELSLAAAGAP